MRVSTPEQAKHLLDRTQPRSRAAVARAGAAPAVQAGIGNDPGCEFLEIDLTPQGLLALNFTIRNRYHEPLTGAAFELNLPKVPGIRVATRRAGADLTSGQGAYPAVKTQLECVRARASLGIVPANSTAMAFGLPLVLVIDSALQGRKMAMRYAIVAQNLPSPVWGRLKLKFRARQSASA
jgi:hypothetical protein